MTEDARTLLSQLANLFQPDAEPPDNELLSELLDDLASAAVDDEVGDLLGGILNEVVNRFPTETQRCEAYLTDLARRLTGRPRTMLLIRVDLLLGGFALEQEQWEEAGTRAARARPAIGPDHFPDQVGYCEMILGFAAENRDDVTAATHHYEAALAEFTAAEDWPSAATAAESLARIADGTGPGRLTQRLGRQAADLMLTAGDEDALQYATYVSQIIVADLRTTPDTADITFTLAKAQEAHEFTARHRVGAERVVLLAMTAILGAHQGLPWEQVAAWFASARREYREVGRNAEQVEIFIAGIDFAEGSAAMGRSRPDLAKQALRAALPVLRRYGRSDEERVCIRLLRGLLGYVKPDPHRAERVGAGREWPDAEALFDLTRTLATEAAREDKALVTEAHEAGRRLENGDADSAQVCVARIEELLTTAGPALHRSAVQSLVIVAGLLRAALAQHNGDPTDAAAELERLEAEMLEAGSGMLAAQVAVQRGRILLELGRAEDATRVLLPATLALDAVRFTLDDADRRERWSAAVSEGFDMAFRAAATANDTRLLAELTAAAQANAIPTHRTTDATVSVAEELVGEARCGDPTPNWSAERATLAGSAVLAGDCDRLGLPAHPRTPWNTVALAEHVAMARKYHDPVRTGTAVGWSVLPTDAAVVADAADEPGTRFDHAVWTNGPSPSTELLADIAATADDQIRQGLIGRALTEYSDNNAGSRRYAHDLEALAALLPDTERRQVRAGIDLILAQDAAEADEWAEANLRITRAGPDIDELLPLVVADRLWVMARCAINDNRIDDARELATQVRERHIVNKRWSDAAQASVVLANLFGYGDNDEKVDRALADWAQAADLYVAAGEPALVAKCVSEAAELATLEIKAPRTKDGTRILQLATAVRELALRHGEVKTAAEIAFTAAANGVPTDMSPEGISVLLTAAREGFRSLDDSPDARVQLASVDMLEAMTFGARGRLREMEPLLLAAMRTARDEGRPDLVSECEGWLAFAIGAVEGRFPPGAKNPRGDDAHSAATAVRALAQVKEGRVENLHAMLAESSDVAVMTGDPDEVVQSNAQAGIVALGLGDPGPAERSVAEIDRYLAVYGSVRGVRTVRRLSTIRLVLQAALAGHHQDQVALLTHMPSLDDMLSSNSGVLGAQLLVDRAQSLLDAREYREALSTALPVALALDAVRFTLPDAERRSSFAASASRGVDIAFRAAAKCGDPTVIAELIEVVRSNAIPMAVGTRDDMDDALAAILGETATASADSVPVGVLSGAAALAGGEHRTTLGVPAHLRTPWNTIALAEHLQLARRFHDPVRADVVVDWTVAPGTP